MTKNEKLRHGLLEAENKETKTEGLLVNPSPQKYQDQWVLTGKNESWEEIHQYIETLFFK